MSNLQEAAQQALEALEYHVEQTRPIHRTSKAITALRAALAEPAPQQGVQEPCQTCASLARAVMLDQVSFDRKPDCYGIRQITDDEGVEEWEDIRTSPDVARDEANDMMATGRGEIYEVVPLWATPQPAPQRPAKSVQEPVAWMHKETGLLRREISRPKGADWDANYWEPLYASPASPAPTSEDIAQEWDLLQEAQAALRDAWAILKKLKTVQDAARNLVESDPDSAADTEGEAFTAWCALVAAIDDADILLCDFGESHE